VYIYPGITISLLFVSFLNFKVCRLRRTLVRFVAVCWVFH
jgi:hypothetical protein